MGGALSTPELADTPAILNFILREMFRNANLVDIYSLADKGRCARYVVAGADALESLFVKIRINPSRGKDGTLYFQSLDGLLKAMPKEVKDKRQQYCMELSFFFIRIFQIYAALFLSIFDSKLPISDPSDEILSESQKVKQGVFINPKEFYGFSQGSQQESTPFGGLLNSSQSSGKGPLSWLGLGGALSTSDGNFYIQADPWRILNYHLVKPGGLTSSEDITMQGVEIRIPQASLYDLTTNDAGVISSRILKPTPAPLLRYFLERNTSRNVISAVLGITFTAEGNYKITLANFQNNGASAPNVRPKSEELKSFGGTPESLGKSYPATRTKGIPVILKAMFEEAANQILGKPPFSVMKFLRSMRYVGSAPNSSGDSNITGTHIFVPGDQENASMVRIYFRDSFVYGAEQKRQPVRITARLSVDEPRHDSLKGTWTYRVFVDLQDAQVQPPEAKDYISMKKYRQKDFVSYSETGVPKSAGDERSLPDYLEKIFQDILLNKNEDGTADARIKFTREGLATPYNSDDIPEDLKVKKLWTALAKDPPVKAHCVARATQLLSVEAIKGNFRPAAFTSACRLNFAYQKDGSIPQPGKPITDSFGIHALAVLFFQLNAGARLTDEPKYKDFLKYMRFIAEKFKSVADTPQPIKASEIKEKAATPLCDMRQDARLLLPAGLAQQLRGVAQNLMSQQAAHISRVMNVIFMLFDRNAVVGKKAFGFNPNILRGGMPEVERVAGMARDLLTNYYRRCETTYNEGLQMIYTYDQKAPLSSITADGSVMPAAIP